MDKKTLDHFLNLGLFIFNYLGLREENGVKTRIYSGKKEAKRFAD